MWLDNDMNLKMDHFKKSCNKIKMHKQYVYFIFMTSTLDRFFIAYHDMRSRICTKVNKFRNPPSHFPTYEEEEAFQGLYKVK